MTAPAARRFILSGRVQGVGFRPFVYRLARDLGLTGSVRNAGAHVHVHVEGEPAALAAFEQRILADAPPLARPRIEAADTAPALGLAQFGIEASAASADADVHVPPDLFCCDDCLAELQDPQARRFGYPFTNCTQCGPRYTIIASLPYDRPATAMAGFELCPACRAEYENPGDRRFHAQPLACPACGPQLHYEDREGRSECRSAALAAAVARLRSGGIVAVKGIGGYHLMCDAADDAAVASLRARKHRPHKPLAVMFPHAGADGLDAMRAHVDLDAAEARACGDPLRPIVLARRRAASGLSTALAPGLGELGVFLPYSPLHHLLLAEFGRPLVATSGNISGEPVLIDEGEARERLAPIADAFLHHDRPILRPADDSVVRVIAGVPRYLRIGRGAGPAELDLADDVLEPMLATGGQMKGAIALAFGRRVVVSPHIGELDTPRGLAVFEQVADDLQRLHGVQAKRLCCDAHPGYTPSRWARRQTLPLSTVGHHAAHASALAGEQPDIGTWLTFTWDGVGLGDTGELWGGEAFLGRPGAWRRVASVRPFHLLGGDQAAREPWRSAAALRWEIGEQWRSTNATALAHAAWQKRIGTAITSSAGRLFDAAAALVLGMDRVSFEGQGPMQLEACAERDANVIVLPQHPDEGGVLRADWAPLLPVLCDASLSPLRRAGVFHASLAAALAAQAEHLARSHRIDAIGLTGGVFQNRLLAELAIARLGGLGIPVYLPALLPANDGGLAFGQIVETAALLKKAVHG